MSKPAKPLPAARASRGLVNPEVTPRESSVAARTNPPQRRIETDTPEPHWQRLVSLVVVVCFVTIEVWLRLHRHK